MVNLKKEDNEDTNEYIWRMCDYKDKGLLDLNWEQVGELINKELFGSDEELYRTSSAYRKPYQYAKDFYDDVFKKRIHGTEKVGIVPINVIPKYRSGDFPGENIISFMNLPIENPERIASKCVWQDIKEVHLISEED